VDISVDTRTLKAAVTKTLTAMPYITRKKKLTVTFTGSLLFITEPKTLTIRATDLETQIEVTIPADSDMIGEFCVDAAAFRDMLKSTPIQEARTAIRVDVAKQKIYIGHSTLNLSRSADDFPPKQSLALDNAHTVNLTASEVQTIAAKLVPFAATDESRPILTSIHLEKNGKKGIAATTADGFRLATLQLTEADGLPKGTPINVSAYVFSNFVRAFGKCKDGVDFTVDPIRGTCAFLWDDDAITAALLCKRREGSYPQYEQLFPAAHTTRCVIPTAPLCSAIQEAYRIVKDLKTQTVRFQVFEEAGKPVVEISAHNDDVGEMRRQIPCRVEGESTSKIAFQGEYLIGVARVLDADTTTLDLSGPSQVAVINANSNYRLLMMPLAVQW
jgi:DNA polymerase III subunit beta